jgi:hypothetical protein
MSMHTCHYADRDTSSCTNCEPIPAVATQVGARVAHVIQNSTCLRFLPPDSGVFVNPISVIYKH